MIKKVRLFLNDYPTSNEVADEVEERFNALGVGTERISVETSVVLSGDADLNIVIGGDGSFLKAVRLSDFSAAPFVGVNTGSLGFFQEVEPENIPEFIHSIMTGDYVTDPIRLLKCTAYKTDGSAEELLCINEVLVKGTCSKVVHMDLYIHNNFLEKFSGDGIIISTAIGSTAYNFSVGGAVVYPALEIMQISPLAPISSSSYRSMLNPIVMPGRFTIELVPETRYDKSIVIVQDGVERHIENISKVVTTMSDTFINRLHVKEGAYWKNIKDKFI